MLVICISGYLIALPALSGDRSVSFSTDAAQFHTQLSQQQIESTAEAITVKVLSSDVLGSGFLIKKQGEVYTVVTNAHVIRAGDPPLRLQTWDGQIYPASLLQNPKFKRNDLALLQFRSPRHSYSVALINSSFNLAIASDVFAAGYAVDDESQSSTGKKPQLKGFIFNSGKVSLMLDKPLEGGYQVGYTNDIQKGMSGGPLLNRWGEVVGINGKHAYPLWDTPSVFQDGSQACPSLQKSIDRTSWAVPIETLVQLAPSSIKLNSQLIPVPQLEPNIIKKGNCQVLRSSRVKIIR